MVLWLKFTSDQFSKVKEKFRGIGNVACLDTGEHMKRILKIESLGEVIKRK